MTQRFPIHPSEEHLEEYLLHRLPDEHATGVEEHLLICEPCQEAVRDLETFLTTMKAAATEPAKRAWKISRAGGIGIASAAAVMLLGLIAVRSGGPANGAPATVQLSSLRSFNSQTEAPAGMPLNLSIEAPDLTAGETYRISVVDASGSTIWTGPAAFTDGHLAAQMPQALGRGIYWVRLYGGDQRQLREFGLLAK